MSIVAMIIKAHLHDHIHEERTPGIGMSMVIVVVKLCGSGTMK
jgi:hypothetical protein